MAIRRRFCLRFQPVVIGDVSRLRHLSVDVSRHLMLGGGGEGGRGGGVA